MRMLLQFILGFCPPVFLFWGIAGFIVPSFLVQKLFHNLKLTIRRWLAASFIILGAMAVFIIASQTIFFCPAINDMDGPNPCGEFGGLYLILLMGTTIFHLFCMLILTTPSASKQDSAAK